ncbi:hypothetical protein GSY71_03105 [Pusillimonas sp. TS35]|uniref:hypothetical protein n=1 Tax=Paracandidimonas lactea TaxID=2895524 RepID=UPI00136F7C1B|nr:hypothetical protein [Paracandidimonas lactea]MYN12138.1 hypothetical protein [Pusillimonas sp. TS35]
MFTSLRSCGTALALAAGTLMLQTPVLASNAFNGVSPVSDLALDHIRGGFSAAYDYGHLKLAMDITQATLINGFIGSAQQLADASGGALTVMQNGLNNVVNLPVLNNVSNSTMNTVIQNSMNNQVISTINTLNITITSQALAQAMAMQSVTQGALLQFSR